MRRPAFAALLGLAVLPGFAAAQPVLNPPPGPGMMGGPGWRHEGHRPADPAAFLMKFYAANTTHDGHLTLAQAKAAGMGPIAEHFTEIDTKHHGYITPYDIEAWRLDAMARRLELRADQLRAQD